MQLQWTSDGFAPYDRPRPGIPLLLDANQRFVEPVCLWILSLALSGSNRPQTWRTYAESLLTFFAFLELRGWTWSRIEPEHIVEFRDYLFRGSEKHTDALATTRSNKRIKPTTVRLRISAVRQFYNWARNKHLISETPFDFEDLLRSDGESFKAVRDFLGTKSRENLPRAILPENLRQILLHLSERDRLIARWAVYTGMRRIEIAALTVADLPEIDQTTLGQVASLPIHLLTTKGSIPRTVYAPVALVNQTLAYIRYEQPTRAKQRHEVFLARNGKPMSTRNITASFSRAVKKAECKATFHELRHTFATEFLRNLKDLSKTKSGFNPLLILKVILGHSDITKTDKYVRALEFDLEVVDICIQRLYRYEAAI